MKKLCLFIWAADQKSTAADFGIKSLTGSLKPKSPHLNMLLYVYDVCEALLMAHV